MKKLFTCICIIAAIMTAGCRVGRDLPPESYLFTIVDCGHFVHSYWIYDAICLKPAGDKGALAIGIPESAYYVWFASVRKKRELYLDLCRKYDDFDYKEIMDMPSTIYIDSRPERIFSGISFRSVDLVCDKDFDEQHPAGTSLADISQLHSKSALPLFDKMRGGQKEFMQSEIRNIIVEELPFAKPLDKLTEYDLAVMSSSVFYNFKAGWPEYDKFVLAYIDIDPPAVPGAYTFTVTMTTTDGDIFEDSLTIEWNGSDI